jgi:hypothetical protein
VHDAERLSAFVRSFVRGVEAVQESDDDRRGDGWRDSPVVAGDGALELPQRLPLHVLHDEEELLVERDDVEGGDDVGVPDAGREAGLVEEHRHELGIARELRMQALDRDRLGEADDAEQATEVHGRHPTGRDLLVERVAPDDSRSGQRGRPHQ